MRDKQELVYKSNRLVEASYRLDLIEQRIILAAIAAARESQKGLGAGYVTLHSKKFSELFGMEEEYLRATERGIADALPTVCDLPRY